MNKYEQLCVENLGDGKALEKVNFELGRLIANCLDPNTDPKATRTVVLKIKVKPVQDRSSAEVTFVAESKIAADVEGVETIHLTKDGAAFVNTAKQMSIEEAMKDMADADGVITMPEGKQGNDKGGN